MLLKTKLSVTALLGASLASVTSCVLIERNTEQQPSQPSITQETIFEEAAVVEEATPEEIPTVDIVIDESPAVILQPEPEPESTIKTIKTTKPNQVQTAEVEDSVEEIQLSKEHTSILCAEIGNKLGSVDTKDCTSQMLQHSAFSVEGRSLAYRDFEPLEDRDALGRVLVIGGIHGDEFSSVSIVFKWMNILQEHHSGLFHWRFIPSSNPDGLLQKKSQRQNASGVDLNRNFPTNDWDELALSYWKEKAYSNERRYPGTHANSEPETQWLVEQIDVFEPDIIISMHAPYHLVDYDGPPSAPDKLGGLYLRQLGVYPGSLGNYIGVDQQKPIVTAELKSAGIMPSDKEIDRMWTDLIRWLRSQLG